MLRNKRAGRVSVMSLSVSLCALVAAQVFPSASFAQEAGPKQGLAKGLAKQDLAPKQESAPTSAEPKADKQKGPKVSTAKPTSPNATINLVNLLVEQGILKEDQADNLIKQAEGEAYVSRQAAKDATSRADEAAKVASAASAAASPPGSKMVTYVPEIVKRQLREEIRSEVMTKARDQNWASPGAYPEWASRIVMYGDLRTRYEGQFFPQGGYNAPGFMTNFNTINTGSPYDVSKAPVGLPTFDSNADRERFRFRARVGMDINLFDGFTAGIRFASGDSNSPLSTNQTLGGSGGNFSKYAAWIDRAFLKYKIGSDVVFNVGRFDNPFFSATDLVWYSDLGFDGAAVQYRHEIFPGFTPFFVAGAFPTFNTDLNFSTNEPVKFKSDDKYLFGGQLGFSSKIVEKVDWTFAVSYFDFYNVRGRVSDPCDVTLVTACSTDALRPSFAQKGNTYMSLRDIAIAINPDPSKPLAQPQYYGLASDYRPLVVSSRLDLAHFNPVHIILDGEYVWNTAFNKDAVAAIAENNFAPSAIPGEVGPYQGGNMGWMARLTVGDKKLAEFGDWNVHVAYKYLESDATLDAFADSDFGLGGTNLKGYIVGGNFALSHNVWMTTRWLSATSIGGPPYAVDVVQVDLNAKF
jgi:hypothetical protein